MAKVTKREWTSPSGEAKSAWVVRYVHGGKHRSKQFEKKKDADRFRLEVENRVSAGTHVAERDGVTVSEACEAFLRASEIRVSDGRISRAHLKNLWQAVDKSIAPRLGHRMMHELTQADIETFYGEMVRLDGLAPTTARERVVKLGQVCEFARVPGRAWMSGRPVEDARKALRGIRQEPVKIFSPEQVLKVIRAADVKRKGQHPRTHRLARCFVHLAAFCGLRWGEIAGLTRRHIDLDACTIRVRHSLDQYDQLKGPKTRAGNRDVIVPDHLVTLLREWFARDFVPNERDLVFRAALSRTDQGPGGAIGAASFHSSYWRPILAEAGLLIGGGDEFHFHALRHFASSWLIANGMPVPDVSQYMGHASFDTTLQVYAHALVTSAGRASIVGGMASRLLDEPETKIAHAAMLPAPRIAQELRRGL